MNSEEVEASEPLLPRPSNQRNAHDRRTCKLLIAFGIAVSVLLLITGFAVKSVNGHKSMVG